jgi:predicted phage tail protein
MKYYRFNRRGRYDIFALHTYLKSQKKTEYLVNTDRSKKLDSFFFENQVWGALHKAWKGYVIAKNKDEFDKMLHYADIIQECQDDLGLEVSSFHDIGKSALAFYSLRAAQIAEENKSNCNNQEQQVAEEEQNYLSDTHYEQERFTDTYTEDFTDDYES